MLRRSLLSLAFVGLCSLFFLESSPVSYSQANDLTEQTMDTADGVKLKGTFYRAANSKNGSVVMLLHQPGKDPTKEDWDGLAKTLVKSGFHVLKFDFRGHGKSTEVMPNKFWKEQLNTTLSGANKNPPLKKLEMKDIAGKNAYAPQMIYDIAGARMALDRLNDDGQINTSSIYIIGAGDVTPLGMLFLTSEWHREAKKPDKGIRVNATQIVSAGYRLQAESKPAGLNYGGCVWLTPLPRTGLGFAKMHELVSTIGRTEDANLRTQTPMLFIHGEKDKEGEKNCKSYVDQVMVAGGGKANAKEKLDTTYLRTIKGTDLKGAGLLGNDGTLGTESLILEFLKKMEEKRGAITRTTREYVEPVKIDIRSFGVGG